MLRSGIHFWEDEGPEQHSLATEYAVSRTISSRSKKDHSYERNNFPTPPQSR
jgi:hypothetical protein